MLDCATQDVASNAIAKDLGNDVIFSSANGSVPWPKGKVCLLNVCVFHDCRFYNTCNILKWDLMGLVFVFKVDTSKDSKVSWYLIDSHGSMAARVKSWGVGKLFEHPRERSTTRVSAPRWVWSSWSFRHPRHGSQYVRVWSCAVPMWRLYAIVLSEMRTRMEWASDEYCKCIATALKTWTSAGGYSLWPSLEAWQSKEIMVQISNGFCFRWFWHVLAVFAFVGPVKPHARIWYCRIWGSLWWFREVVIFCLAMLGRDLERSRRVCSVFCFCLFHLLQKCRGELQALAMPICIARPKVGGFSRPTGCTRFLPHKEEGFVGLIFHSSFARRLGLRYSDSIVSILFFMLFWGSWRYRLPSFLMCFGTWEMWSVAYALRIYGSSCPEVPAAATTFQAWSLANFLPWTNQFEANQILKRIVKNHGRTWCVRILKSGFGLGNFSLTWMLPPNNFPGCKNCRTTSLSCASCRGNPTEPLDRWRTHRPPTVAIEAISWGKTYLPMAWTRQKTIKNWQGENHLAWYIMV